MRVEAVIFHAGLIELDRHSRAGVIVELVAVALFLFVEVGYREVRLSARDEDRESKDRDQ